MKEARCALVQLEDFLDLLPLEMWKSGELQSILQHLETFKSEIKEPTNNIHFKILRECVSSEPINELKKHKEKPFSSSAYKLVLKPIGSAGVYARNAMAKGEVVISEQHQLLAQFIESIFTPAAIVDIRATVP